MVVMEEEITIPWVSSIHTQARRLDEFKDIDKLDLDNIMEVLHVEYNANLVTPNMCQDLYDWPSLAALHINIGFITSFLLLLHPWLLLLH